MFFSQILQIIFILVGRNGYSFQNLMFSHSSNSIPVFANKFKLHYFSINTSGLYEEGRWVTCRAADLKKAIVEPFIIKKQPDDSLRFLIPSFKPFEGKASWKILNSTKSEDSCTSMAPYFNAIGLSSLNIHTGQAMIYLAAFEVKKINGFLGEKKSPDENLNLILNPDYTTKNLLSFPAHCSLFTAKGIKTFLFNSELTCLLDNGRGTLTMKAISVDPINTPDKLLKEIIHDTKILEGKIILPEN